MAMSVVPQETSPKAKGGDSMTFVVNRKSLLGELGVLQAVATGKQNQPVLSNVMMGMVGDELSLTATDMDVTICTSIPANGDTWGGCLPCRQLYQLVGLLDTDQVEFTPKSGHVQIGKGKSKHLLPLTDIAHFPEVDRPEGEVITIPANVFSEMLRHTVFAAMEKASNPTNQKFSGVNFTLKDGLLQLAATNTQRFAAASVAIETALGFEVVVSKEVLEALVLNNGDLSITVTPNWIAFIGGERRTYGRLIEGKFPDWQSIFPAKYNHTAIVENAPLALAIKRALLTAGEKGNFVRDGLRWTLAGSDLVIESRGGDSGKSDETVGIECVSLNGNSAVFGMNGAQVIDGLKLLGEKVNCEFTEDVDIVRLTPVSPSPINFQYYLNTVSLKQW